MSKDRFIRIDGKDVPVSEDVYYAFKRPAWAERKRREIRAEQSTEGEDMGVSKLNGEGYHDPTAYEALTAVAREEKKKPYRPLVFICSPLAGNMERNLENARRYSKYAVEMTARPARSKARSWSAKPEKSPVWLTR